MKRFGDLNSIERLRYMQKPYLEMTRRNISEQQRELELERKKLEGTLDGEEDLNFSGKISSIEKNIRSNKSYINQFSEYFTYEAQAPNRATIKADSRNTFISNSAKVVYQFNKLNDDLEEIVDDIKKFPADIEYSQFNNLYKLYNDYVKTYNNKNRFNKLVSPINPNASNLTGVVANDGLAYYIQQIIAESRRMTNYINDIKSYSQRYGQDKGKIGAGYVPRRFL